MAKAGSSSSAKSDSKKQVSKDSTASPKKKPEESSKAASPKVAAKSAAASAKPAAKAPSKGRDKDPAAGSAAKAKAPEPKSPKAEVTTNAAVKHPAAKESTKVPMPAAREAKTAPPKEAERAQPAPPPPTPAVEKTLESAPQAKAPEQTGPPAVTETTTTPPTAPKPEYKPIGPNMLDGFELPAVYGNAGVFGGPIDRSAKPDDKLALPTGLHFQYERYRSLNPKSFYCAMRWDYRQEHKSTEEGKRWWANKKLLVTNPLNGNSVVVRAVDYGPHESTGLAISVSPGAAEALGINPGDDVLVAFADPKAPTGAVA